MWSGRVEGRLFGGNPAPPRDPARHMWGTVTLPSVSVPSVSLPVDLSLASAQALLRKGQQTNASPETKRSELSEMAAPPMTADDSKNSVTPELEESFPKPLPTPAQMDIREFSSVKEVLLEMTNQKNGHTKLPVARWGIIKKEAEQLSLKVTKFATNEDTKGAFPRPTALVNPFPADIIPLNGNAQVRFQAKPEESSTREVNKHCAVNKVSKQPVRQRVLKNDNGQSKKKHLSAIVAQLAGSLKGASTSQVAQTEKLNVNKLITPDCVSYTSSHRLSGGEVSVTEQRDRAAEPDSSVVDRLKRLGTVIEIEDQQESNSLKMLEINTKRASSLPAEDGARTSIQQIPKHHPYQKSLAIPTTLYISKDVTLIPKISQEPVPSLQEKMDPSLLEPVIDIFEEENLLSQDGTFLFKSDSYHSVDLPNSQKVFSCDICSAVYSYSNMLRRHYFKLHISRKYISEKDMETFNIDPENVIATKEEKMIFRCHICRNCFPNKNDLRSHLTDHPPVVGLIKQNKTRPTYKCENCPGEYRFRKSFDKHKKICKAPLTPSTSATLPVAEHKIDLFHCLYCNETFLNANIKRNHILSNHPYVRRKHNCVFCKKDAFTNNVNLFTHLVTEHSTVYFGCQLCKERFTNLEQLKGHVDKKHESDDKLKLSLMERTSTILQEKEFYTCDTCQRRFLIEVSFKEHVCFPEKQEKPKPKLQKIKKKPYLTSAERIEKRENRNMDAETLFYSQVCNNVRDNLLNYLDGKIYKVATSEDDDDKSQDDRFSTSGHARTLNFSAGFDSSPEKDNENGRSEIRARSKAPWEKFNFKKNYDGRCGLTSYIKDASYLDLSTQAIMRRNLQRLNMLPMKEAQSEDVPSVLALERLSAECAESFGQIEKKGDSGEELPELGSLSGEWVRERMYVCSVCSWETPCLWTMEDHKYLCHPNIHCPQHELIGEQSSLAKTIYTRLVNVEPPFQGPKVPSRPDPATITCTKCSRGNFNDQNEFHIHILECAGVVLELNGPTTSRRKKKRKRNRTRRGLKRNIPSTPQKQPSKPRTKPGDTDTIQRMIANLPPKRVSRKVFSAYEEARLKNKGKNQNDNRGKKKSTGGKTQPEPPTTPTKEEHMQAREQVQIMLQKPTMIKKEQDYIDTSAEGGDVLSSLRMMPVRSIKPLSESVNVPENKESSHGFSQTDDKEMPKLEIEKDLSPVESSEIPVLSPVERKEDLRKDKDDLICGVTIIDGLIKNESVASVLQETKKIQINRKRKANNTSNKEAKKCKQAPQVLTRSKHKEDLNNEGDNHSNSEDTEALLLITKTTITTTDSADTKEDAPKRRGRPKGSLTRKFSAVGSRRSNRISKDNSFLKFDEILPCDEAEEVLNKKPNDEKPKRKPRTIKNCDTSVIDSTTIVVKAEIHPEPVSKRKITEDIHMESDNNIVEMAAKKLKEEVSTDEKKPQAIDVYDFVEEIQEIDLTTSPMKNSKIEALPKGQTNKQINPVDSKQSNSLLPENNQLIDKLNQADSNVGSQKIIGIITNSDCDTKEIPADKKIIENQKNSFEDVEDLSESKILTEKNEVTSSGSSVTDTNLSESYDQFIKAEKKSDSLEDILVTDEKNSLSDAEQLNNNTELTGNEFYTINGEAVAPNKLVENSITKKKKTPKKTSKSSKKSTSIKNNTLSSSGKSDKKTEELLTLDISDDVEKSVKVKKTKKQLKKDKESLELGEVKRPKKVIKKRKVIKKIVKLKKRRPSKLQLEMSTGSEVLNIAGFKWEVSELEAPMTIEDKAMAVILGSKEESDAKSTDGVDSAEQLTEASTSAAATAPITATAPPTSIASVAATAPPTAEPLTWQPPTEPWETNTNEPGLGTILDSVNKLLNEPENTYTPLGLPSYSLADLQKAMGASDAEMAVLQQLGEASLQITSNDGSCSIGIRGDNEEWSNEKCIMDLDNQSNPSLSQSISLQASLHQDHSPDSLVTSIKDDPDSQLQGKEEEAMPNSLLAAHQGKEVLCPSCSCHFMGFPALQQHMAKAHPTVGPKAKPKKSGTASSKIDLSRRLPLDSSQSPRLICYSCQQILPSDRMSIHLEQEHALPAGDVSKCSRLSGDSNDGPVVGERLKSKMSSALGGLLDRAMLNLINSKQKSNRLSGGAVDLLTKLCAVWKREGSVKGSVFRLQGARELISKLQNHKEGMLDEEALKVIPPCKPYSCTICGQKFTLPASRNKHEVLAHRSFRVSNTPEPYELDDYDNDWREAPSPPEVNGDHGSENTISPQCFDCGLSFETMPEMMRHRLEDHTTRRPSFDASNFSGCSPSPAPSSGGSHSLPDSETEDSSSGSKRRKASKSLRLGAQVAHQAQAVTRSVKERAEAALRELNLPRQKADKRWAPSPCNSKQKSDVYSFTDESS